MKFSEKDLQRYAQPLPKTEEEKCKNAIEQVCEALQRYGFSLSDKAISLLVEGSYSYARTMCDNTGAKVTIFIQGSYANDTCIAYESDVDIAIIRNDIHDSLFGSIYKQPYCTHKKEAESLKEYVQWSLEDKFSKVTRGNKSVKVPGNSNRISADVVPCIELTYYPNSENHDYMTYFKGTVIYADDGTKVVNFPKLHIFNAKNKDYVTDGKFKKMVRVAKEMRSIMECCYRSAREISSFEIESLLYNVPYEVYAKYTYNYGYIFDEIVSYLYSNLKNVKYFNEVNGIKPLCLDPSREKVLHSFIGDLKNFYEYSPTEA